MTLLMLLFACQGDEPKIDENGCWLDGEEAFIAFTEVSCAAPRVCDPNGVPQDEVDDCVYRSMEDMGRFRESLCFDGCAMDACLATWERYTETCEDYSQVSYCYEETFYDGLRKECVQRPW